VNLLFEDEEMKGCALVKEVKKVLQGKVQSAEGRVEKIMRDVIRLVPDS
jgi:hypothetical protein